MMIRRHSVNSLQDLGALCQSATSLLRALVQIRTENPPGDTRRAVDLLTEWSSAHGFRAIQVGEGIKQNLLIVEGNAGPTFLLNAHLDTVPSGDPSGWSVPPFEGVERDGRLYGRGAADNKGGVTAALHALLLLQARVALTHGRVCVMCVADEEVGGALGTGKVVEGGYLNDLSPTAAIVCDGSGIENGQWGLRVAAKGVLHLEVVVSGAAAHGARPERGRNAVLGMASVLLALNELTFPHAARHSLLGTPTVAPGTTISGGVAENVIPSSCRATVDLRTTPGLDVGAVLAEARSKVEAAAASWGCQSSVEILREIPAQQTSPEEPIVLDAAAAIRDITGQEPVLRGLIGSNDARYLLARSIPTVIGLSPSDASLSRSHGTDESVGMADVVTAARIYARTVKRWAERGE